MASNRNIFWGNIRWNIRHTIVQHRLATTTRGRNKSGFYKTAILLGCSVVEALAHRYLEQEMVKLPESKIPLLDWECFESQVLPDSFSVSGIPLAVCRRRRPKFEIDSWTEFAKVNSICLKLKLFSEPFYQKIDTVRIMRNKIHLQSLERVETSWSRKDFNRMSSVMLKLVDKVR